MVPSSSGQTLKATSSIKRETGLPQETPGVPPLSGLHPRTLRREGRKPFHRLIKSLLPAAGAARAGEFRADHEPPGSSIDGKRTKALGQVPAHHEGERACLEDRVVGSRLTRSQLQHGGPSGDLLDDADGFYLFALVELCELLSCRVGKGNHLIPPAVLPGVSRVQSLRDVSPCAGQNSVKLSLPRRLVRDLFPDS